MRKVYTALVAFALLVMGCGGAYTKPVLSLRMAEGVAVSFVDSLPGDDLGETGCDSVNKPHIIILRAIQGTAEYNEIYFHERIHAAQAKDFGNCQAWLNKYNKNQDFRFQMEADAYMGSMVAYQIQPLMAMEATILYHLQNSAYRFTYPADSLRKKVASALHTRLPH